jgi:hypothetical protein
MADATSNQPLRFAGPVYTEKFILDTSGAQTTYKGIPMVIDANVDTVYAHTQAGLTLVDGDVFLGIAAESVTVASGATENTFVECYVEPTIVGFKSAVFTEADLGKPVYMSDTSTLTASNGTYSRIGKLWRVKDGYAYVYLSTPAVVDVP